MPQEATYSAFISYASEDRTKADEICASLEGRGFTCWIAPRDVRPGAQYGDEIIRGIMQSRCLVVLLSQASNQSEYVPREVERAVSYGKPVFPVRLEEVLPSRSLEFFISTTQWIDAWTGMLEEHVDLLASRLKDSTVLKETGAASRRLARRRALPRWVLAGGGFLVLVAAIVVGNQLSSRWSRQSSAPTSPANPAPHESAASDSNRSIDTIFSGLGFKPTEIKQADIVPRLTIGPGRQNSASIRIEMPDVLRSALPYGKAIYFIGDQPVAPVAGNGAIRLGAAAQQALANAKSITISYEFRNGQKIGPFTYPLEFNPGDAMRQTCKAAALADPFWLTCKDGFASFERLSGYFPAVKRIHLGQTKENLDRAIEVPQPGSALDDQTVRRLANNYRWEYIPYLQGAELFVQLEFFDGTRSDVRPARMQQTGPPVIGLRLEAQSDATNGGKSPALFVAYPGPAENLEFTPEAPPGTEQVMYSSDDKGFYKARRLGNPAASAHAAGGFRFDGPVKDSSIVLSFKSSGGGELGPFRYELKNVDDLALARHKRGFAARLDGAIDCIRVDAPVGNDHLNAAAQQNQRSFEGLGFLSDTDLPAIACVPDMTARAGDVEFQSSWCAVREVRVGVQSGKLETVAPVTLKLDQILGVAERGRARRFSQTNRGELWKAVLPADAESVFARFVFYDGSVSDEIRLPIRKLGR